MNIRKRFLIKKTKVSDVVANLPPMLNMERKSSVLDYFIGTCGFEERILGVPRLLNETASTISKGILLGAYQTNPLENNERRQELLPYIESLNTNITYFDADSPEDIYKAIAGILALTNENKNAPLTIGLDISGGSATFITSAILSLARHTQNINLIVFYTTAKSYHEPHKTHRDDPVSVWTESDLRERGVLDVSANELAPGIQHDHLPSYVIAIPSMFPARLQRSLSFLGIGSLGGVDEHVFWILPKTDDAVHQWRQLQVKKSLLCMIYGSQEVMGSDRELPDGLWAYCDVLDYKECVRIIMDQKQEHCSANVSIIHAGTKVQAIGTALAIAARSEIALVKTRPQEFSAKSYSTGIGDSYTITFQNINSICESLAAVGRFEVENN
jgi:hypothetical protein